MTKQLLDKLHQVGVLLTPSKGLGQIAKLSASSFCRRRLGVVMVKLRMSQNMKQAITFIEQGHVRVGPNVVNDPAFLVCRSMEDFITWTDSSKIRRHLQEYNDSRDDYDLLEL